MKKTYERPTLAKAGELPSMTAAQLQQGAVLISPIFKLPNPE